MAKEMKFLFKRLLISWWKCSFLRCLCRMSLNWRMILYSLLVSSIFISLISLKHSHRLPSLFTWKCIICRWIPPIWWFTSSIVPRSWTVLSWRLIAGLSSILQVNEHWSLSRLEICRMKVFTRISSGTIKPVAIVRWSLDFEKWTSGALLLWRMNHFISLRTMNFVFSFLRVS